MTRMKIIVSGIAVLGAVVAIALSFVDSVSASAKIYSISTTLDKSSIKAGEKANFTLTITPKDGYVMKVDTPFKAILEGTAMVEIARDQFSNKDFADPKAPAKSIKTDFTAVRAGKQSISADLTFFICNDQLCERLKDTAEVEFDVK